MKKSLLALAIAALASSAQGQNIADGRAHFDRYCATCHGGDARGDGPMAPILLLQPSDLTQIKNRAKGAFPTLRVIAKIDGRDAFLAHGSSMPVYGEFFEGRGVTIRGEEGILIMTSQPIVDLIAYLQSIQAAPQ